MTARPPTTPPAMAPAGSALEEAAAAAVGVGVELTTGPDEAATDDEEGEEVGGE